MTTTKSSSIIKTTTKSSKEAVTINNLKALREKKDYTQAALALKVGVSQQSVAKWETGKALPRGEMLIKLSTVLGCSIDELLGGTHDINQ